MKFDIPVYVALIIGLIEVFKRIGLATRFLPVSAMLLGLACAYLGNVGGSSVSNLFIGIALGLSSMGLFSGTKSTIQKK